KTNIGSSTQRKTGVEKQTYSTFSGKKRSQPESQSSSKKCSKPNKSINLDFKLKHIEKENISQTDLLQKI
ncbi:3972_t:CDS:1, partial [Gigaspora margarita]